MISEDLKQKLNIALLKIENSENFDISRCYNICSYLVDKAISQNNLNYSWRNNYYTLLHYFIEFGFLEEIKLLLDNGANPNVRNNDKLTPLMLAIKNNNFKIAKLLIEHNADVNTENILGYSIGTALTHAISHHNHNIEIIKLLLDNGANPNVQNSNGYSPLKLAMGKKDIRLVKLLLQYGANPNLKNMYGKTPLNYAKSESNKDIIDLFKQAKKIRKEYLKSQDLVEEDLKKEQEKQKPKDEVEILLERIQNITNSLEESTKNKINDKINELITEYKKDIENAKPKLNLETENEVNLSTNYTSIELRKTVLIENLNRIISQLSNQEVLVNFLNEINNYQSLLGTKIETPSKLETLEDKILYIISISQKYNNESILASLKITLDSMDIYVSDKLSKIITGDIELESNYDPDIKGILRDKINVLYENVEKYITISSILKGTYGNKLSYTINNLRTTINSLYSEDQTKYENELTKLEEEITFNFCENKTLKEIEDIITEKIKVLSDSLNSISKISIIKKELLNDLTISKDNEKNPISSLINDIYSLMEENQINEETKKEVIKKINSIIEKWKKLILENKISIDNTNSILRDAYISDKLKIESDILNELAKIKMNIEFYINEKEEYDEVNKSI